MGIPRGGAWDGKEPVRVRKKSLEKLNGIQLAESYPEQFRNLLSPHIPAYCEALVAGVAKGDRTCMIVFPKVMGVIGDHEEVIKNFLAALGARSLEDAKRVMDRWKHAERMDDEAMERFALDFLNERAAKTGRKFVGFLTEDV